MSQYYHRLIIAIVFTSITAMQLLAQEKTPRSIALTPAESLASIEIENGFEIKIIAHEPQVIDPVDAAFDDQGRLWVVEMRDYPYPTSDSPSGCVRILSDNDLDGHFESSVVFADQLDMPTGIALWKDGAVITLAGQVVWFRDTDGDLKSDTQQVWIEGFARENEQLRANHPRLGPDGWWYIASGLRGGNVIAGPDFRKPDDQPITLGSRDVRFNPQTKQLEAITGPAQFGLCFDSIGNRIFCSNRNPAVMVRFEQEDLVGNPLAGLIPSVVDLIPSGEQSKVYPLVNAWTTSNLHSGQFTAACGVFYHEFASEVWHITDEKTLIQGSRIFTCEPTGSLVHSVQFSGLPSRKPIHESEGVEWLASRDAWFRPVNIAQAPDGGVLVVDMHRAVIEHPAWVPDELKKRPDERWGNDSGRIFHIASTTLPLELIKFNPLGIAPPPIEFEIKQLRANPLSSRKSEDLVQLVANTNPWLRETARRLLIERKASEQTDSLKEIVLNEQLRMPVRLCALQLAALLSVEAQPDERNTVSSLIKGLLAPEQNATASSLTPSKIDLKIAALRIASQNRNLRPNSLEALLPSIESEDRLLIETLRYIGSSGVGIPKDLEIQLTKALKSTLTSHAYSSAAESSGAGKLLVSAGNAYKDRPQALLIALLECSNDGLSVWDQYETYPIAATRLAATVLDKSDAFATILYEKSMEGRSGDIWHPSRVGLAVLAELISRKPKLPQLQKTLDSDSLWNSLRSVAENVKFTSPNRHQVIAILGKSTRATDNEYLAQLAREVESPLRTNALRAWASTEDTACDEFLLGELASSSPQLQQVLLDLIGQKPERLAALADQLAAGKITAKRIGSNELKKLATRAKGETQTKLNEALDSIVNSDRAKVVTDYQTSLTMTADALRGKEVFVKHCASCHKVADVGVQVGPDISDSRTQQPTQILTNILDPNRAIDNNYFRFVALTADDQVIEGMIAEETSDSIVLRGQNNARHTLKRADLQELKATGVSLMPEGLESQIDHQAMADLISFVKNWRYLDGSIPK